MKINDLLGKIGKKEKKNSAKKVAIGAGLGTLVGLAAGALFAPKSGKETREDLAKGAKTALDTAKKTLDEVKEKVEKLSKQENEKCCSEVNDASDECCCQGECTEDKSAQ